MRGPTQGLGPELGGYFTNRFGDRFLYAVNRHTFDQRSAVEVFRHRFHDGLFHNNSLYIIVGTDSGLLVKHVLNKGCPDGTRYLFVELPELIATVRSELPSLQSHPQIGLCTPEQALERATAWSLREYVYLDAVHTVRSIAAEDGSLPGYGPAFADIDKAVTQAQWGIRKDFSSCVFMRRQIENMAENRVSAMVLKDSFPGSTAVVLGGGPSLDDLLPWVKENREGLAVIAVSRICRRLRDENLIPDIIVSIDPHEVSFDVSKEMFEFWRDALLVNGNHITPFLLGQWRGRNLFLDHRFPWPSQHDPSNIRGSGPTVTNTGLNLATLMGFSQIVLGGVDLCFTREGFTHARGSNERIAGPQVGFVGQTVETNGGWLAETDNAYFTARRTIEIQAEFATGRGCQFVNPAPGAAKIKDVEFRPLTEIDFQPTPRPAREILQDLLPEDSPQTRIAHYELVLKQLDHAQARLADVESLAREALECNDGLFGRNGKKANFKYKLRMDRIERKLNQQYPDFARLTKFFGISVFVKTLRPDTNQQWTDEEIEAAGRLYYQAYLKGSDFLSQLLRIARARLECRLDEESDHPDIQAMADRWRKDNQPGRALLWKQRQPGVAAKLSAEERRVLDTLEEEYRAKLAETDTPHMRRSRNLAKIKGIESKAFDFFMNQDRHGLERLQAGLQSHGDPAAVPLCRLVDGYIAELDGRPDDALEDYQQITDGAALEPALIRIVVISLDRGDFDNSKLALGILGQLSPYYLPRYADLLRITGDVETALDILTQYLSLAPEDLSAMMQLGRLYHSLGVKEGARWVYEHVVKQDPEHTAAKSLLDELDSVA